MANNLVFRWSKPLIFPWVLGAHGTIIVWVIDVIPLPSNSGKSRFWLLAKTQFPLGR